MNATAATPPSHTLFHRHNRRSVVICLLKLGEGTAQLELLIVMLDTASAEQQSDVKLLADANDGASIKIGHAPDYV